MRWAGAAIAIQPIAFNDPSRLAFVQHEISSFYHCPVYVFPGVDMPAAFLDLTKGERYSADSILRWLAHRRNDFVAILLGLTGKDIYVANKDDDGRESMCDRRCTLPIDRRR